MRPLHGIGLFVFGPRGQENPLTPHLVHANALSEFHLIHFSPDGIRFAMVAGDSPQVWDTKTGQSIAGPLRQAALLLLVRFSPERTRIVTAANDGTACLWDAITGYQISEPL